MPVKRPMSRQSKFSLFFRFGRIPILGLLIVLFTVGLAYPSSPSLVRAAQKLISGFSATLVSAHPVQGGCTVNCGATSPATAEINQAAAFTSTATTDGCVGAPSFQWDFGDNSGSVLQNP